MPVFLFESKILRKAFLCFFFHFYSVIFFVVVLSFLLFCFYFFFNSFWYWIMMHLSIDNCFRNNRIVLVYSILKKKESPNQIFIILNKCYVLRIECLYRIIRDNPFKSIKISMKLFMTSNFNKTVQTYD